jgi:hypothetical protein
MILKNDIPELSYGIKYYTSLDDEQNYFYGESRKLNINEDIKYTSENFILKDGILLIDWSKKLNN